MELDLESGVKPGVEKPEPWDRTKKTRNRPLSVHLLSILLRSQLQRSLSTVQDIQDVRCDGRATVRQKPCATNEAMAALSLKRNDALGVAQDDKIGVVGRHYDLPGSLVQREDYSDTFCDVSVVKVVLRLIHHERTISQFEQYRKYSCASLPC